ncbi:MAG: hypothetical protein A3C43_02640 [Candidatus Schekmanbacteria bacterium RIFCSPHIGHO2_02_FULL_38_11]|uniref:DUF2062 domain-containing protein n=1 Tax=Candidatus Schekmanbacteria bacterium RIFCSPLOWO2_12_FULL_38_15 TaxID=1817883 RepID=A0A1F7SJQ2_9BACT|nr:MAG: hypothetical protein A2043_06410 [Candidatus Schekmanbacteria bacterium GWA2_38_9]OGL50772.1 MAG: hypothetical protein A3H37_02865 [Candidatus Schekmanbacteria bacterium RIFCSPLOWO2_02_FULL_38_14]OGL53468.1 MAG: hypothetical protein A3G31_08200 [Candidatus Schekmanbacteria bacterium RIFCSPLOWO2_12_FULL_38_15]OGL54963.1 MAG: hypothetical protein A3C43_02640 [Candidatus Schekmanbacteria bacterium RIFCSPHIGHO2_02_FULL_38_11]
MNLLKSLKEGFEHILKLDDPPHKVALGFAIGIFSGFTPFLGFHLILAVVLAWFFRVRIRVAALGTLVHNPWTIPFIYGGNLVVGNKLVGSASPVTLNYILNFANDFGEALFALNLKAFKLLFYDFLIIAKPFAVGTVVLGFLSSFISYLIIFVVLKNIKNKKTGP